MLSEFQILNIGVEGLPEKKTNRVQITNLLTVIAVFVSFLYLVLYFSLKAVVPGIINIVAIFLYLVTFFWTFQRHYRLAKIWVISTHMVHLSLLTLIVFTKDTGIHFYYLIIPAAAALVFEHEDMKDKLILSIFAILFFFSCELLEIFNPYIQLSQFTNQILFLSSILIAFIGGLFVVFMFTFNIKKYEDEQLELIKDLKSALSEVKILKGFLPICASCKKIRDDKGYWNQKRVTSKNIQRQNLVIAFVLHAQMSFMAKKIGISK